MPLSYQPSVPFLALLATCVVGLVSKGEILSPRDRRLGWGLGVISALALYPAALGLGRVDPYAWGWGARLPLVVAAATIFLTALGKRAAWLPALALLVWALNLFESTNLWDYLVDPIFPLVGLVAIFRRTAPPVPPIGSSAT